MKSNNRFYNTMERQANKIACCESDINLTTYSDLANLKKEKKLIPGSKYRFTYSCILSADYEYRNQVKSDMKNNFDLILTAISEDSFDENVQALPSIGDTYFTGEFCKNNLSAWEIKYCFDNDLNRFDWACIDGMGVIYYLKDEFNNSCEYDFKNIKFKLYKVTACEKITSMVGKYVFNIPSNTDYTTDPNTSNYFYTFSFIDDVDNKFDIYDSSVYQYKWVDDSNNTVTTFNNDIKGRYVRWDSVDDKTTFRSLSKNVFVEYESLRVANDNEKGISNVNIGIDGMQNIFSNATYRINIASGLEKSYFGNFSADIKIGDQCRRLLFDGDSDFIEIGSRCDKIYLYTSSNIFIKNSVNNINSTLTEGVPIGSLYYISIDETCNHINFASGEFTDISFKSGCSFIDLGPDSSRLKFESDCYKINLTDSNNEVIFGKEVSYIISDKTFNNCYFQDGVKGITFNKSGSRPLYIYNVKVKTPMEFKISNNNTGHMVLYDDLMANSEKFNIEIEQDKSGKLVMSWKEDGITIKGKTKSITNLTGDWTDIS